jgi:hypothetical protein
VTAALVLALAILANPCRPASACGHCVEDKVAATYDHAVLARAARDRHVVVYAEIRGPAAGSGSGLRAFIVRTLATTLGIDGGTIRVSLDPPAASFACDPARHAPVALITAANARLADRGLSLAVLKLDRGPRRK